MAEVRPEVAALVGGATLIGGIAIGKAAVDAGRTKFIPPGEKRGYQRTLDDSVRFVGAIVGIGLALFQLPSAWEQAKKLVEKIE